MDDKIVMVSSATIEDAINSSAIVFSAQLAMADVNKELTEKQCKKVCEYFGSALAVVKVKLMGEDEDSCQ